MSSFPCLSLTQKLNQARAKRLKDSEQGKECGDRDEEGRAGPDRCCVYQLFPRSEKLDRSDENAGKRVLLLWASFWCTQSIQMWTIESQHSLDAYSLREHWNLLILHWRVNQSESLPLSLCTSFKRNTRLEFPGPPRAFKCISGKQNAVQRSPSAGLWTQATLALWRLNTSLYFLPKAVILTQRWKQSKRHWQGCQETIKKDFLPPFCSRLVDVQ